MVRHKATYLRTVSDFLLWEPALADAQRLALSQVRCPRKVCGHSVPADINGLSFEQLTRLWEIKTSADLFFVGGSVLFGLPQKRIARSDVLPWVGFANWLCGEILRVNELWNGIPKSVTPEELQAGAGRMSFGVFGIADWYARRMGLTNHDDAFATGWVRIYQCMRNDAEEREYQRRLQEILSKRNKR